VGCYAESSADGSVSTFRPSDLPTGGSPPDVVALVTRGIEAAGKARARTVLIDTAGRLQIDQEMMAELERLKAAFTPHEILLVADGMTGQDAVRIAQGFHAALGITGVILTKLDGDARGGAALSIYGITRAPIKYVGTGERLEALEPFHPERMAGRILQQGDILSLVEKAQATVSEDEARQLAKKAVSRKGLDLQDFLTAMKQMQKLGPLKNVLGMLARVNSAMLKGVNLSADRLKHVEAIVLSMTPAERADPELMSGSRRLRVAKGSGRSVQEVNQLLAQFKQMQKVMKVAGKPGTKLPFGPRFPG
jgi:signal recognition particle subunit SRP54